MRITKVVALLITLFMAGSAWSQVIPLDKKQWNSMSQVGVIPPVWSGIPLSNWVFNDGLQIKPAGATQNQMCMAGADANCSALTAPGPGAIWNVRIMDGNGATLSDVNLMNGAVIPITEYGLKTVAGNYFWDTGLGTPQFVRWGGTTIADDVASTYMPYVGSFGMGYDTVGGNWDRNSRHAYGDTLSVTQMGLDTMAFNLFYDTAGNTRRWYGTTLADDLASPTVPYTGSFSMGYDTVGGNWDRNSRHAAGDALSATQMGLDSTSFTHFYEGGGSTFRRWYGDDLGNATYLPANLYAPFTQNFLYGWDSVNDDRWHRLIVDDTGALVTAGSGSMAIKDGDSAVLADVIDAYADNLSVSLNGLMTGAVLYAYDGATLDMLRTGAVGELQVTDVATRPGEDAANDWRKTKKQEIAVSSPAKETSGAIDTAPAVVILAAREVLNWPNFCIYVKNNDAADPLVSCTIEYSPDATSWTAGVAMSAVCTSLASGQTCQYCVSGNSSRYIRVSATATDANPVSTVDTWWVGNKG